jgi:hypothetical protein
MIMKLAPEEGLSQQRQLSQQTTLTWAKCYKTFYVRNLLLFETNLSVCPAKPFLPNLLFVINVKACLRCFTLCLTQKH